MQMTNEELYEEINKRIEEMKRDVGDNFKELFETNRQFIAQITGNSSDIKNLKEEAARVEIRLREDMAKSELRVNELIGKLLHSTLDFENSMRELLTKALAKEKTDREHAFEDCKILEDLKGKVMWGKMKGFVYVNFGIFLFNILYLGFWAYNFIVHWGQHTK